MARRRTMLRGLQAEVGEACGSFVMDADGVTNSRAKRSDIVDAEKRPDHSGSGRVDGTGGWELQAGGGLSYLILEGAPKDGPKVKLMTREPGQQLDRATARLEA